MDFTIPQDLEDYYAELVAFIEAEINPLFVLPRGQGVRAADGVAVLAAGG